MIGTEEGASMQEVQSFIEDSAWVTGNDFVQRED